MIPKYSQDLRVTRVSSAAIKSACSNASTPRGEKSDKLPMGVPTTNSFPLIHFLLCKHGDAVTALLCPVCHGFYKFHRSPAFPGKNPPAHFQRTERVPQSALAGRLFFLLTKISWALLWAAAERTGAVLARCQPCAYTRMRRKAAGGVGKDKISQPYFKAADAAALTSSRVQAPSMACNSFASIRVDNPSSLLLVGRIAGNHI